MNGAREPLLAGLVRDSSSGQGGQQGDLSSQDGLQCHASGLGEEHLETCCSGGAAPHPGAPSDLKYEVVADCGTAPPED